MKNSVGVGAEVGGFSARAADSAGAATRSSVVESLRASPLTIRLINLPERRCMPRPGPRLGPGLAANKQSAFAEGSNRDLSTLSRIVAIEPTSEIGARAAISPGPALDEHGARLRAAFASPEIARGSGAALNSSPNAGISLPDPLSHQPSAKRRGRVADTAL